MGETEKVRESLMGKRNINWLPVTPPTGDLAYHPGMCPDQESFGFGDYAQPTKPHQSGPNTDASITVIIKIKIIFD